MKVRIKSVPNSARNASKWHGLGGNLYDGLTEGSQQMETGGVQQSNNRDVDPHVLTVTVDGREYHIKDSAVKAKKLRLRDPEGNPMDITPELEAKIFEAIADAKNNKAVLDAQGSLEYGDQNTAELLPHEPVDNNNNFASLGYVAKNYFDELNYRLKTDPSSIALQGKYTMPVIAASALLPWLGEAAANTSIAGIPATTLANTAAAAGFAGHGLNHAINEGIDGYGDAAMTALELAPLGRVARPIWNMGKEVAYNIADRYTFMPHQGSFTRGIGMTDAGLQDAITTGVFRGNPRGTEQTAKVFDKMFLKNRNHFRDIVEDTGIPGIESRYQSRTLTKEDFDALKRASEKYISSESGNNVGKITLKQSVDPLENYATYEDYSKAVASDIAKTEQMPSRIASGEVVPNTELSEPMWFEDESGRMLLPQGKPFLERFGPNSDYLADGTPLSYWYADGRNPVTQGHAYAKSNYGVRVNIPEDYQPFMHELHLHPSFFRSPKFSDPNVEIFGKGPLGLTVKLDKETLQPVWKKDLFNILTTPK